MNVAKTVSMIEVCLIWTCSAAENINNNKEEQ